MLSPDAFQLSLFRIMLDCFRAGCLIKGRPSAKSALHKARDRRNAPRPVRDRVAARRGRDGGVVVKVLPASFSQDADRLRRFEQEARAASALNHPNILRIYDIGMHEGAPYLVSELLEGQSLRDRLQDGALLKERSRQGYVPSYYFVLMHTALGEKDLAFESLERAYQERSTVLAYLRLDPRLAPLRSDPRFDNLLARLGVGPSLTPRAKSSGSN
jgi:hypothetical protein